MEEKKMHCLINTGLCQGQGTEGSKAGSVSGSPRAHRQLPCNLAECCEGKARCLVEYTDRSGLGKPVLLQEGGLL